MSVKTKIIRTDLELECPHVDKVLRDSGYDLVLLPDNVDEDILIEEAKDAALILMCYTPITARVFENAPHLKGIIKYGVGIDAIDIKSAIAHKVPVVNIPEYAEETVAEGAFSLLISLAKKLTPINDSMNKDGWVWPEGRWIGNDIAEKTVGLIGTGKIGRSMARMAGVGFRARILGYDPHVDAETMKAHGIEKCDSLMEMLPQCDFVTIHGVLSDDSHHIMGKAEFTAMKESAYFINVSRGAIADELALLEALKNKQIAGAGLDVYSQEPLDQTSHPLRELYDMDNVILFPHLTFYTIEAMKRLEVETLDRCFEALKGNPLQIKSKDPRLLAQTHGVTFI